MVDGIAALSLLGAVLIPLGMVLALGNPMIRWLRRIGAGQRVRDDGPQRHLQKEGTPTMGGLLILGAVLAGVAAGGYPLWAFMSGHPELWQPLLFAGVVLGFAGIGFADDWLKVRRGRSLGLRARQKLFLQLAVALLYAFGCARFWHSTFFAPDILPHWGDHPRPPGINTLCIIWGMWHDEPVVDLNPLGWGPLSIWAVFWALAMVATSNAMNLADGLDGLAAGCGLIAFVGVAVVATGSLRDDMDFPSARSDVVVAAWALAAACLGFLWYNRHPARLFMGDVGSLALGAAMAAMAARLDAPLALLGLCLVPFIEMLSVIIQVISFKTTGKRVFKMSPIHHHFELSGWSERKVVYVFWLVQAVAAAAVVAWCLTRVRL